MPTQHGRKGNGLSTDFLSWVVVEEAGWGSSQLLELVSLPPKQHGAGSKGLLDKR